MTAAPVQLRHENPNHARTLLVDWCLGTQCNYSCTYCPDSLHDGRYAFPPLQTATAFASVLLDHYSRPGRRVTFQFTGGEPTLYPDLLALARMVKEKGASVVVISNGSRPAEWWREAAEVLDTVILTFHIEFASCRFRTVVEMLASRVRTHVNVTMLPERFEDCLAAAQSLADACRTATFTLKPLLAGFGDELYPYTEQQKSLMQTTRLGAVDPTAPHGRSRMTLAYKDRMETVRPADLILSGRNRWRGWACYAGLELISITPQGRVFRSLCRQGGPVGSMYEANISFPDKPMACEKEICHCATDILTTKIAPGEVM